MYRKERDLCHFINQMIYTASWGQSPAPERVEDHGWVPPVWVSRCRHWVSVAVRIESTLGRLLVGTGFCHTN